MLYTFLSPYPVVSHSNHGGKITSLQDLRIVDFSFMLGIYLLKRYDKSIKLILQEIKPYCLIMHDLWVLIVCYVLILAKPIKPNAILTYTNYQI